MHQFQRFLSTATLVLSFLAAASVAGYAEEPVPPATQEKDASPPALEAPRLTLSAETGFDIKVTNIHSPGASAILYKDPFKLYSNGDNRLDEEDLFNYDEYIRQTFGLNLAAVKGGLEARLSIGLAANYFGAGYLEGVRVTDSIPLTLNSLEGSLKTEHFTAEVGEKRIIGFKDFLYYHNPASPEDYNFGGITVEAGSHFFGVGQRTERMDSKGIPLPVWDPQTPTDTSKDYQHDFRYTAIRKTGLFGAPLNTYIGVEEYLEPDRFEKTKRNMIVAMETGGSVAGFDLRADAATNDEFEGTLLRGNISRNFGPVLLEAGYENAKNFRGIQPAWYFHDRDTKGYDAGARNRAGYQVRLSSRLGAVGLSLGTGVYDKKPATYTAGASLAAAGWEARTDVATSEETRVASAGLKKALKFGPSTLELFGAYDQAKSLKAADQPAVDNREYGVNFSHAVNDRLTFLAAWNYADKGISFAQAPWTYSDKYVGVANPGLAITRKAGVEYKFADNVVAEVKFWNLELTAREPGKSYIIEQTIAKVAFQF
ncbi:MAG: hypothetical protein ACM3TT_04440 [Syntrophothermus sp.]